MADKKKIKVGMVQINNSFDRQNYLPLSLGFLHSYAQKHAKNFDDFEFSMPIYKRIQVDKAVESLLGSDIVAFSSYVWNFEISKEIARRLKQEDKDTLILFGGCHVPDTREKGLEKFLRENPFIDLASPGEGEKPFTSFLENYPERNWKDVPSLAFLDEGKNFVYTNEGLSMRDLVKKKKEIDPTMGSLTKQRVEDLNEIPSPFLTGYFEKLMNANPGENWIGLFETNRGCPFSCRFCDWGIDAKKRMADYDLEGRLFSEIDWFSEKKVSFVYCCDANFGMYKNRDLSIAQKFAENKKKFGFPERFSVQNTKNSSDSSYNIQKVLVESGLDKGVLLAFQSLHEESLEAVKRSNIDIETFFDLQRRFTSEGITTFSDIILGLPCETYQTFIDGVSTLIEKGQHNRIQFNNLSILPNAPMIEDIKKYGLEVVDTRIINIHGSLAETEEIEEKQRLVIGSNTMPKEDWTRARAFGYMTAFLHFDKLLQIPNILLNTQYGIKYGDIADRFLHANPVERPILSKIGQFFFYKAKDIQNGGAEYCESKKWLNIWWPADELAYINIAAEDRLDNFYAEAHNTLDKMLEEKNHEGYKEVLSEAILLNRNLLKMPFQKEDLTLYLKYNVIDIYKAGLIAEKVSIQRGNYSCIINRTSDKWDSWEDWSRRVVWWGNKKGDYIYSCNQISKEGEKC